MPALPEALDDLLHGGLVSVGTDPQHAACLFARARNLSVAKFRGQRFLWCSGRRLRGRSRKAQPGAASRPRWARFEVDIAELADTGGGKVQLLAAPRPDEQAESEDNESGKSDQRLGRRGRCEGRQRG